MSAVSGASTLRAPVGARRPSEQAHVAVMLSRAIGAAMGCALWRTGVSVAGAACTMARTADPPDCPPASRRQVRLLAGRRGRAGRFGYGWHRRWSGDGTWEQILDALRAGCDQEQAEARTVAADATVVRAHQHAAGARHAPPRDIDPGRPAVAVLSGPARIRGGAD